MSSVAPTNGQEGASSDAHPTLDGLEWIDIDLIDPHPDNPRLRHDEELVAALAEAITADGFDPAHAPVLRAMENGRYQTISGHRRILATRRAGLKKITAWPRRMTDQEALEALAYSNLQEGLTKLEIALHSLTVAPAQGKPGAGLKSYARRFGIKPSTMSRYRKGAEVFSRLRDLGTCENVLTSCLELDRVEHLAQLHDLPDDQLVELATECLADRWSISKTKEKVSAVTETSAGDSEEQPGADEGAPTGPEPGNVAPNPFAVLHQKDEETDDADEEPDADSRTPPSDHGPDEIGDEVDLAEGGDELEDDADDAAEPAEVLAESDDDADDHRDEDEAVDIWEALDAMVEPLLEALEVASRDDRKRAYVWCRAFLTRCGEVVKRKRAA